MSTLDTVAHIADLATRREQADAELQAACLAALADGVPATLVADAARINRTTLWRWQQSA